MSAPTCSTPRRVPPPCWTREETLALIEAYSSRWNSVNRGSLRAADWDAVAADLAESSSSDPPKSSIQCRHKIEKLRKRFRAEKERLVKHPGRFSSWDLFPFLDAIEIASVGSKQSEVIVEANDMADGFRTKNLDDRHMVAPKKYIDANIDRDLYSNLDLNPDLAFRARKYSKINGDYKPNFSFERDLGTGFRADSVSVAFRPKDYGHEFGIKMNKTERDRIYMPQGQGVSMKGYDTICGDSSPYIGNIGDDIDTHAGFPVNTGGNRNLVPPRIKRKKYRKTDRNASPNFDGGCDDNIDNRSDKTDMFWKNVVDDWSSAPSEFVPRNYCKINGSSKHDVGSKVLNEYGNVKMNGIRAGVKRGMDPVGELVSSIQLFTEGFVKVEKMKMEMVMEIEKLRMQMDLKHNQMILKSQKQIVDAFTTALLQNKEKNENVEVLSPNSNRNEDSQVAGADRESIGKNSIVKDECEGVLP